MAQPLVPTDPEVIRWTRGLVSYIRELVRGSRKMIRTAIDDNRVFWLAHADRQDLLVDSPVLLELAYPPPPNPPIPPDVLQPWLVQAAWKDSGGPTPELTDPSGKPVAGGEAVPEDVSRAYEGWVQRWRIWKEQDRSRAAWWANYERLERLRREASQLSDTHELVLGVGLLTVNGDDGRWAIRRHVLIADVTVTVEQTTDVLRLYLAKDLQYRVEDREFLEPKDGLRENVGRSPWGDDVVGHPLSGDIADWLGRWRSKSWGNPLRFEPDQWQPPQPRTAQIAELSLAPAVFLRPRDQGGLAAFYDEIAAQLDKTGTAPSLSLAQLVAPIERADRARWLRESATSVRPVVSEDPLFPLSTNREQRRVLDNLSGDSGVVVQGPPGTGKTHTIANLICALLADGQRILITSQKDQALRVLRKELPDSVQQLCVLMTGMQRSGADELDRSITALSDLAAINSPEQLCREIDALRQQRDQLTAHITTATRNLQTLREQEYAQLLGAPAGYEGTLTDLVRALNSGRDRFGWIGPLPRRAASQPPLTDGEAEELHQLLVTENPERLARAGQQIPATDLLPSPTRFAAMITSLGRAESVLGQDRSAPSWRLANLTTDLLREMQVQVEAAADALATCGLHETIREWDATDWRLTAAEALLGRRNQAYWNALFDEVADVEQHVRALAALDGQLVDLGPHVATPASLHRLLGQARRLRSHLARGRRLRRFRPTRVQTAASEVLENCTLDGLPPTTVPELSILITVLQAEIAVSTALDAWSHALVPVDPGPLRRRLAQLKDVSRSIAAITRLIAARDNLEQMLRRGGIRHPIRSATDWDLIVRLTQVEPVLTQGREAIHAIALAAESMDAWNMKDQAAPEVADLAAALVDRDRAAYSAAYARLDQARTDHDTQHRCQALFHRLATAHPTLAEQLYTGRSDPAWAERLASLAQAWAWGRACAYHRMARDPDSERDLEQRIDEIEQRLNAATAELAGKQALLHCLTRMTEPQRQALQSYRTAMTNYGKGQGRHRHRHLSAARDAMREARNAVPAWVMPLATIADTIPPQQDAFDVVIVDEASQAPIDSLFLLWLAPRVIVVGDDKQCAPGLSPNSELHLVAEAADHHLEGMRLHLRNGFSPTSNLYDLLSTHFPPIRLSEHFRSMPEIIGWSSAQFYDDRLIPLRQFGADRLDPLRVVRVENAEEEGRDATLRNRAEAEAIIDQVQKIIDDPINRKRNIGIIALQDGGQVRLLNAMLNERVDPADIKRFDIRVGNPPDFQGDQRDIVLLSMVVTKARRSLTTKQERRRFNVAASRARDQMWLFVSVGPGVLKDGDLRYSLLTYMLNPPATLATDPALDDVPHDQLRPPFDSLLEQQVFLHLRRRGYAVVPQYPVDNRRVDLLVVGDSGRLAIECDTSALPPTTEELERNLLRERELRRSDWQFVRIRESEYLHDPEAALQPLWHKLQQRGIEPRSLPAAARSRAQWSPIRLPDDDDDT